MGCQLFRNCLRNVNRKKSFVPGLTVINGLRKGIYYILDDIFVSFYRSDLRIEALTGYEKMTCSKKLPGYERFQDMVIFQDMENF